MINLWMCLFPQIMEDIVEQFKICATGCNFRKGSSEQIVEVSVPQVDVLETLQFQVRAITHKILRKAFRRRIPQEKVLD